MLVARHLVRGYFILGLIIAIVYPHRLLPGCFTNGAYPRACVPGGVVALQPERSFLDATKVRAVSLGGWLVIEKWMKTSLFDGIPDGDLLDGAQISLQSTSKGTYVTAEGGGGDRMVVNREAISTWETFKIWRVSAGVFQLRVFNKLFVSAVKGGGGAVLANAASPAQWETFKIYRNPSKSSMVHIQAYNGMYLQARNRNQLTADWEDVPSWDNNDATFIMKVNTPLGGEYQLANGWGADAAVNVFEEHRESFVQESDFWFLASNGINAVRIPVGYWIASDPNPPAPYVSGSLQALDNAFQWANNHGIKIIIDLHAAPGSQNGQEHSSSRDGSAEWAVQGGIDYMGESIKTIDFLASRYGNNQALLGIELLNEPGVAVIPLDVLKDYYTRGYSTVRKYTSSAYVIMCQRIGGDFAELVNVLPADKVVLDIHFYNLFNSELFGKKTPQWNIDFVYNDRLSLVKRLNTAGNALIFVGEWTNEWLVEGASQSDYQRFGAAQLQVFGQATFGWAYWSYQHQLNRWSFKQSVQQGYLKPPTNGW